MKITRTEIHPIPAQTQAPAQNGAERKAAAGTAPRAAAQPPAVGAETLQLRQAAARLADTPDVDHEKVEQIRQAIADGKLPLDLDALSKAVLDLHRP